MTTAQIVRLSFKKSWKVQSPLLWYFVAISLFFSMKGQVGCSSTILGLGSLPVARVVAEHAMDIAAVNISTCSFTLILMLIWMSQCFVKMNISTIFTWHPEIEELPRRALYATKNRLWLNKAFLPPWMFTAQRLVDDYLQDIVIGVNDTQIDSIQYLNFAKKWFNSIFNSILFHKNSIQKIIQFNFFKENSIQNIIQLKKNSKKFNSKNYSIQ